MFEIFKEKINQKTADEEVQALISENSESLFNEIEKITDLIKNGTEKSVLFDTIKKECDNEKFCDIVINLISNQIIPFEDMEHLRSLRYEDFKEKIKFLFENTILKSEIHEVVQKGFGYNDKQLECTIKLLNTITEWVVIRRFTSARFHCEIYDIFRLEREKSEYLFRLYTDNLQTLTNIALFDNIALCKGLRADVIKLLDIFKNIFDDEESSEEE